MALVFLGLLIDVTT